MNSNLPIPGLGQLEPKDTPQPSDPIIENSSASATINDVPDTSMTEERNVGVAAGEITETINKAPTADADAEVHDTNKLQHGSVVVDEGYVEDVNMQDQQSHETDATASNASMPGSGPQDNVMAGSGEAQAQKVAAVSPPASPHITDALEAALDGLLGPTDQVGTENTDATVADRAGEQASEHNAPGNSTSDVPSTSGHPPAEGTADEHPEWEADSSPYQSSSSDSSDSSDDDESDVEESNLGIEETARLLMEADGGSDDEMDGARAAKQAAGVRTKNEQPDEPEPMPDIQIKADETIIPLGIVQHVVEGTQLVIEALRDGTANTVLDRGTPLCKEDRTVLGTVHDTIATVHKPMYILKFRSEEEVKAAGLERGTQIWYPKSLANLVFPSQLRQEKGSDASNLHDEEVGPDEVEYSDDEQEQAHKREKKNRKRGKGKSNNKGDDHDWRTANTNGDGNLKYDEDDEGPYKPLSRPANFGMGLPPPPPPPGVPVFPATHGGRGGQHQGRRGDSRGRGGRGRGFGGRGRGSHGHNGHQSTPQPQSSYQPPPPFATNPPPVPGQWPFPVPPVPPQFGGSAPSNPSTSSAGYAMPNWGAAGQSAPFPFPPVPPVPNWPNATALRPPQQAGYSPPPGGYSMPVPYPPNGAANASAAPNSYQYPNYYGGGQAQNGQSQQRWG